MILTKEQIGEMKELAKPLVKWMNDNLHPHTTVIVETTGVSIHEALAAEIITEFLKD